MKRFLGITTEGLARICGVSQGTVDRALNGRDGINPETKRKILEVAREYGYAPKVKNVTSRRSMLIGVVLFDLYNAFFSKLAMSLTKAAKVVGYSVIFQFSDKNERTERAALEYFDYIGVDGIILFPIGSDATEYKEYLCTIKRPLVSIGNRIDGVDYIGIDDKEAMRALAMKILSETKGDAVYFAPALKRRLHSENAQLLRLEGCRAAAKELGRKISVISDENEIPTDVSAVISSTDHYVLRVLKRLGTDTSARLAGFDNVDLFASLGKRIATVEYSTDTIASECLKYILGRKCEMNVPFSVVEG